MVMFYTTLPTIKDASVRGQPSFKDPNSVSNAGLKTGGIFLTAGMTMDEMVRSLCPLQ